MTKEDILSSKPHVLYPDNKNNSKDYAEEVVLEAMDEYAKQQAIEFDIWKLKNHWIWDASILKYFKWENDNKHETKLSHNEIYARFIEQK